MRNWTDDQKKAIDAEGCSVIVSAAAGSGKTAVLVERLLKIIADNKKRIPVEKMIIATFTRDAAAEMKQRLSSSLSALSEKNPENVWLSRQISMLGCASIATITSFCIDLLRSNISQLSLSSSFRVIEPTEDKTLQMQAYKNVSGYFYSDRPDEMRILRNNFCKTNDDMLEAMVYELYEKISSVPFFELWLDNAEKKYTDRTYEYACAELLENDIISCGNDFKSALNAAKKLDNERVLELIESESMSFENAVRHFREKDFAGFSDLISDMEFANFPSVRKNDDRDIRSFIMACRKRYKKLIGSLAKRSDIFHYAEEDRERSLEVIKAVSAFMKSFSAEHSRIKESKNAISFSDAESLTLTLLADIQEDGTIQKTPLADELSDYYEIIMIDEFQDSNNKQDMIFRLLSKGGDAEKYGSNLFFVGDVKQAIYRFRLADPRNFINALDSSVPYKKGNAGISSVRLSKNFRSSDGVIDFSNYIFSCIMSRGCGDIDYTEDEYLYRGASFFSAERKPVVMLFDSKDGSPENSEARHVAHKISQMLKDGAPVSTDGGKGFRPCKMSDFCILMRNKKKMKLYSDELEKLGIMSEGSAESGYLKAREIAVLINILKVTDNPLLDTPLMSVMLSPMFMFTPDDAAKIRLIDKKSSLYLNLCDGLGLNGSEPVFEGELMEKAKILHSSITAFRLQAGACTLQELIRKIYDSTDFMSVMQLYGDAERKKANLRMLLEYAGNYEKNSDGGLTGFLRFIDSVMDSGGDLQTAHDPHGSENAVAIKTMHGSKGLEFPFVFIVGTNTRFNTMDSAGAFQFSYELGLGFRLQDTQKYERYPSLAYEVINAQNRMNFISEEMRLLYVAMTRAKERLFLTMSTSSTEQNKAQKYAKAIYAQKGIDASLTSSASCMQDWILMCLISHSKSAKLREIFEINESFRYDNDFDIEYETCVPHTDAEDEIRSISERSSADTDMVKRLCGMFSFEYDMSFSKLTAKLSVSDVSKKDDDFETQLKRPEFARESSLTPAEKGTALHRFLQFADLYLLETDIDRELNRLYNTGYLTKKQKECIKYEDVEAFLRSDIFKAVKSCIKVHREKKFLISINDLDPGGELGEEYKNTSGMINGIIDMTLEFEDHLILVDYKTDRVSDVNELSRRYSGQLSLYKRALEKTEEKPVKKAIIYSFYKKTEVEITEEKA
ncbi:MAG: helicase-exonuclease AddAB subunit AddA [Clostridium sp.]|nr:helicase-exonuclease AddAB subunit AddA [Clostridium sp.]MCM1547217.1 helicase-exonuclease AddAB subunit AddA [Ruminococcus sp.]